MVNKAGEERNIAIDVDGQELEQLRDFRYLGQIITDDGRCDKEVKRTVAIARSNFINMKDVLATRKLKWDTRMRLVRFYILGNIPVERAKDAVWREPGVVCYHTPCAFCSGVA